MVIENINICFPSITQDWGNSLCEDMTAGLPFVSLDCEVSPSHMIKDKENGFFGTCWRYRTFSITN